jgi:transglutaminase-like putative cysteine protease
MSRASILHVTDFEYDGLVSESHNEVRLRPRDDARQSCLSFRLSTRPASGGSVHQDYFGNWVHRFNVLAPHRTLRIEAASVVMVHPAPPVGELPSLRELDDRRQDLAEEFFEFLAASRYVPHPAALGALIADAEGAGSGTVAGFARAATRLIHERFRYEKGATHVHSSAEQVLSTGAGVCQDFTHLLLAVARVRGIPGRYVSGYLLPGGDTGDAVSGGLASHAWAEILVPGEGWLGLDPTQGDVAGERHIRLAYGRDYGDVPPVRGTFRGHAGQRLSVDVHVRPGVDGAGRELLREATGAPVETPPLATAPQQQQ